MITAMDSTMSRTDFSFDRLGGGGAVGWVSPVSPARSAGWLFSVTSLDTPPIVPYAGGALETTPGIAHQMGTLLSCTNSG
ncbi:hypothetical protein GCM10009757_22190 [Streptomyces cheonanensis]|uniref:Uncharacterized protein n=1 Tax=Streptomyces cheonanensis TaxID=312720 RepID=A0ABN2V395_9ACTN